MTHYLRVDAGRWQRAFGSKSSSFTLGGVRWYLWARFTFGALNQYLAYDPGLDRAPWRSLNFIIQLGRSLDYFGLCLDMPLSSTICGADILATWPRESGRTTRGFPEPAAVQFL